MNLQKLTKRILCFAMALLLCLSIFREPVKAKATGLESLIAAPIVGVAIDTAIAGMMAAVGLEVVSETAAYQTLITSIGNGLSDAYKYIDENGDTYLKLAQINSGLYASRELTQAVLDAVTVSNAVNTAVAGAPSGDFSTPTSEPSLDAILLYWANHPEYNFKYCYELYHSGELRGYALTETPIKVSQVNGSGGNFVFWCDGFGVAHSYYLWRGQYEIQVCSGYFSTPLYIQSVPYGSGAGVSALSSKRIDLPATFSAAAGYGVKAMDSALESDVYTNWITSAVPGYADPGTTGTPNEDEKEGYIPVGLPDGSPIGWTQEDAQSGKGTFDQSSAVSTGLTIYVHGTGATVPEETAPATEPETPEESNPVVVPPPLDLTATDAVGWIKNVYNWLESFPAKLQTMWDAATQTIGEFITDVGTIIVNTGQSVIDGIIGGLADLGTVIVNAIQALPQVITDTASAICDVVLGGIETLTSTLADALADVKTGVDALVVPETDYLSAKLAAIRVRFPFVDSLLPLVGNLRDTINGGNPSPPIIYIDLPASEGTIYWGPRTVLMDLSWYERYKPAADAIMSGFLWAVFLWRMIVKIPGIIQGMPGEIVMMGMETTGVSAWLPERKRYNSSNRRSNK